MRRWPLLLFAFLFLALPASGARAGSPYVVSGFAASAEAEDGVKAKEAALARAMAEAFARVAGRISVGGAVPTPSAGQIDALVSSFSFESEVLGATSYGARLTVRFDPVGTRRYLAGQGLKVVDQAAPEILVVPVLVEGERFLLWEDAAAWHRAIEAQAPGDSLTPAELPANGRVDRELDPDYLLSLAQLEVTKLRMAYRTHSVMLAVAEPKDGTVRLTLRGEDATGPVDSAIDAEGGLDEAAARLVSALETRWKRAVGGLPVEQPRPAAAAATTAATSALRGTVEAGAEQQAAPPAVPGLRVRVILRRGDDWSQIRRRIEASAAVSGIALDHLAPNQAEVRLWPRNDPGDLAARLGRQGLDLFKAGETWMLQAY